MPARDDTQLLDAIARGDRAAFTVFYDRHSARIYGVLLRLLRDARAADDVLQETFWQVWTYAGRFKPERGLPVAWVLLIARSRAVDYRRRETRRAAADVDDQDLPAAEPSVSSAESADVARVVQQALRNLPEDQEQAIRAAFYDGLTYSEIASRDGTPLGTVKTRIRLAMQKLRASLEGDFDGVV